MDPSKWTGLNDIMSGVSNSTLMVRSSTAAPYLHGFGAMPIVTVPSDLTLFWLCRLSDWPVKDDIRVLGDFTGMPFPYPFVSIRVTAHVFSSTVKGLVFTLKCDQHMSNTTHNIVLCVNSLMQSFRFNVTA